METRTLLVGMARSGLAAAELLRRQDGQVTATDNSAADLPEATRQKLAALGVDLVPQDEGALESIDEVVLSPGVAMDAPIAMAARERDISVIGEVELASRYLRGPILGITGSNGKTTTTALTGHILQRAGIACQIGGNIGLPPTAMVESSREDQWNVLELSSFQLETIQRFRARVAVCLNVTPDHLDRHHTMEAYVEAKGQLFATQESSDWAVLNAQDETCRAYAERTQAQTLWFQEHAPADGRGLWLERDRVVCDGRALLLISEVPLPGRHNLQNAMAAAGAALLAGATRAQMAAAIRTFPGVEHRLEFTRERRGVRYYNDSKATNVDATLKAIDSFPGGLWVILGGKDKDSDYTVLRGPLRAKAHAALLIGAAAEKIAGQLGDAVPLVQAGTLEQAVQHAAGQAQSGDVVVLAPACASFDQFDNFEHRGRVFKQVVASLPDA